VAKLDRVSAVEFRRAADDVEMDPATTERFVLGGEVRLRGVFAVWA
jgi:hypothetical protein